jgi:hypothetical protein
MSRTEVHVRRPSEVQKRFPCRRRTGGKRAASGDAKASVVFERLPMPVGIQPAKQEDTIMKKLLVVLLSLGLILAFGMTASAQTSVKFSGQYYVVGVYEDNRTLSGGTLDDYSRAYFWTRTRVQTVFNVAEGLSFTTRFDAFEKQWGNANRSSNTTEDKSNSGKFQNNNVALQENLEMEYGFVTFKTAIGIFDIGYQAADEWGTVFGDIPGSRPRAKFTTAFGPFTLLALFEKVYEADTATTTTQTVTISQAPATFPVTYNVATTATTAPSGKSFADADNYVLAGIFNWKGGNAGLLYKYVNGDNNQPLGAFSTQVHVLAPYMKGQFGPVYVEGEVIYQVGKARKYQDSAATADVDKESLGGYALAKVNIGPAYIGGQFGYSQGQNSNNVANDGTVLKDTTGPVSTTAWNPTLIFGQANLKSWVYGNDIGGTLAATQGITSPATYNANKQNLWLYNIFAGFNVTPKFNIEGMFSYMYADQKPYVIVTNADKSKSKVPYLSDAYGMEADIKVSYKIYDNLTYMVGAGYLWTGDYFKGINGNNQISNDYLLMNQLTLNF